MANIALSKSSLQQQRDRLRLFERFLPSLELKRQQLTAEYKKAVEVLAQAEQGADQASRSLTALLPILGSARMNLSGLVRIRHVEVAEEDVLGLRLPTLRAVEFDTAAARDFRRLPRQVQERLAAALRAWPSIPGPAGPRSSPGRGTSTASGRAPT